MARQYGVAGEWARVRGTVLSLWPLFLSFVMAGAFFASLLHSHLDFESSIGGGSFNVFRYAGEGAL